ncbi:MAG: UMP kinase [Acidobacteria bacterium]|nr:UMP kinase [Acidobacteriota bacterium]
MARCSRILLKLSGEVLAGQNTSGIDPAKLASLAAEIAAVGKSGVQLGMVVGGGNFFRGVAAVARNMGRVAADSMGMLATVMNALALADALELAGLPARVLSAIEMNRVCEYFTAQRAIEHLESGRAVLLAAGTGNPYFSTDTGAVLRALEIRADVMAKATRVDGVYDKDPLKHPDAVKFSQISFQEVLERRLGVMDATAAALCRDNKMPAVVFNMHVEGNIMRMAMGEPIGTVIS